MPKGKDRKVVFQYPMEIEVRPLKIHRASSLAYLDAEKLSRAAKTEFDVGHVVVGATRRSVRATVRKGIVTGIRVEGCADCKPVEMSPQLRQLLMEARRRVNPRGPRPWRPVSVREYLASQHDVEMDCFYICFRPFFCIWCCRTESEAFCFPIILGGPRPIGP
jgi:hypothetical protein